MTTENDTITDLTISMRGQAEDKQAEFEIYGGQRVRIELGRVYLVKTIHSVEDSHFPHGSAFTLTKVRNDSTIRESYVDTERIAVGGGYIETGWLRTSSITKLVPA